MRRALGQKSRPFPSEFHVKPRSQNINRPAILIETRIRCELIVERHVNPFVDFEIIIKFNHVLDAVVRQLTVANQNSEASSIEESLGGVTDSSCHLC